MEDKELHILIEKYLAGTASTKESEKLINWYRANGNEDIIWDYEDENEVSKRILTGIEYKTFTKRKFKKLRYGVAAAVILALSLFTYFKFNSQDNIDTKLLTKILPDEEIENKYILLPDSSIVILKPGSQLKYPSTFDGEMREVELTGEGYFDIKHEKNHPFIIHTGKVKTTVLGTAFSVKATNEEDVEIFVHRGKVKVENEKREIAILTPNRKLIYHPITDMDEKENSIVVEDVFDWEDTNLDFDGLTFGDIAKKLENRYDAKIIFKNDDLVNYQLSGTFSEIQNIDEILSILCKISKSKYIKTGDNQFEIKKINN